MNLVYMAKPIYGGWVTFTSHLALKYEAQLYKIGKRTEPNQRDYGYGVKYRNLRIDDFLKLDNILITAVDKHYWKYLDLFPNGTKVVIHDPTELKGKENKLRELLDNFEVITIRESVKNFLLENFKKESTFLPHPFFEYKKDGVGEKCDYYSLCISRIDFDKNINLILHANKLLDETKKIYLFGAENRLYVHHKLKDMEFEKYWMGKYPKNLPMKYENKDLLDNCAFVVDMSIIVGDGGGTQYTFLEAIYHNCALILHKDWVEKGKTFKNGYNCFVVGYTDNIGEEISSIINNGVNVEYKKIVKNASKLLKIHTKDLWKDIFS
tara:strand:+ start:166 stop:1134 length:969 start_codon:yes stop_codon:yes gene_type:complete